MKKVSLFVVLMAAGALILTACGASPAQPSGGGAPAPSGGTAQPTAKPSGNVQPTQAAAAPAATEAGNSTVELNTVTEGLGTLNSYKTAFIMSFDGKDKDGKAQSSSLSFEEEYQKDPPARRTQYSGLGPNVSAANPADNSSEIILIGGKTYWTFGTTCSSSDSMDAPSSNPTFSPSDVMGSVRSSQLLGTENINGVSAKHYSLDVAPLVTLGAYANAKGEVWIADQGNFVVKYIFEATGQNALFGGSTGTEGTVKWNYEVTSINQPVNITAPTNCGGAAEDIPTMADASAKFAAGGSSGYTSASAFEDVVNFYKKEMPGKGWTAAEDEGFSNEGFATLIYTKDNRKVSITITFDQDKKTTSVMIIEEKT